MLHPLISRRLRRPPEPRATRIDRADPRRVARLDRVGLRLDSESVVRHPNGWVDVWGVATRVGVFLYDDEENPGRVIREYRPPSEVFRPESLASLHGVPFTIDHPLEPVDASNFRDLVHGSVLRVRPEGSLVKTQIRVATTDALAEIERGTLELSCGYTAKLETRSGVTPQGEPFDAVQTGILYNHLALVDRARAGSVARLHLDGRPCRLQATR